MQLPSDVLQQVLMKAAAINKLTSTVAHVHLLLNKVCRQWWSVNLRLTASFRQCEYHFYANVNVSVVYTLKQKVMPAPSIQ